MKFQGFNSDKRSTKEQIHKFYLQNTVSTSVMSNSTQVIGELLLEKTVIICHILQRLISEKTVTVTVRFAVHQVVIFPQSVSALASLS